jgi:hypothetical protein
MATYTGNDGAVSVNGKAIANVKTFSVDIKADTIETSAMGVDARTYVKGLSSFSGSADVLFDTVDWDTAGEVTTFNPTDTGSLVGASGVSVKFFVYTDKSSGNDIAFTGSVIVTGYNIKSSFDGLVEATISFQGTDLVTYATGNTVYP